MAKAFHQAFDLSVVTLEPSYPDPALFERSAWEASDRARGIRVVRSRAFKPHDASLVRRALREIGMSLGLVSRVGGRAELIVVSTPSMFLAPLAYARARFSGARFVWDVRDLTWRYALESVPATGVKRGLLIQLERTMLAVMRRADLVIAATPGLGQVLLEQGVGKERMITVPNGVSREQLERWSGIEPVSPGARPRVTYVGLMGYNHGIGILVDVARLLPEWDVVLVGDGPERPRIEERLRRDPIPNLTLAGYVTDPAELARHYGASDALVNHTQDAPILNRIVHPAKLLEYFATGRPVIYAGTGFAADFLVERDLAVVVPPNDPPALAAGIRRVLQHPDQARERSARGRRMIETEFTREAQMQALVEEIRRRFAPKS
jgi:glycosyltransferase involved in cell wall biosynthesis